MHSTDIRPMAKSPKKKNITSLGKSTWLPLYRRVQRWKYRNRCARHLGFEQRHFRGTLYHDLINPAHHCDFAITGHPRPFMRRIVMMKFRLAHLAQRVQVWRMEDNASIGRYLARYR